MSQTCPVCQLELLSEPRSVPQRNLTVYECGNCGRYELDGLSEETVVPDLSKLERSILAHAIFKMQRANETPLIHNKIIELIIANPSAPSPAYQADSLIMWLGSYLQTPGEEVGLWVDTHSAVMGAVDSDNFIFVLSYLLDQGLLNGYAGSTEGPDVIPKPWQVTLSFDGWKRYEELKRGSVHSRSAFMAMPYGNKRLNKVFRSCFQPAVRRTGFNLYTLQQQPKAGLIDDTLRVELRRCRFVVAELTSGNQGAYWESGFAEGLGKPVFYTCEETYFSKKKTHFDTNHLLTIIWRIDRLDDAADRLKAAIRATLPDEASLNDVEDPSLPGEETAGGL